MNQATAKIKPMKGSFPLLQQQREIQKLIKENEQLKDKIIYWLKEMNEIQDSYVELLEAYNKKISPSSVLKVVRD